MSLHIGKGRTVGKAISDIIDYVENPEKTDGGRLISSYRCDSRIADAEFLLSTQKLQTHMMELYRKHGANPLGGCLPLLLQMPIFFAIYRVLYNAIELKGAAWIGWITDLSIMDPYFVLPILMGASMFVQQHITPTSFTDPMQEKVFKYLPVIFTIFFITFPSGLVLYWLVSNIFSIAQQYTINRIMESRKQLLKGEHDEKN